jgi:integrase
MRAVPKPERIEKPIGPGQYFTKQEAEMFLKSANNTPYFNMFTFMLNTGLRIGETSAIKKDSFDFDSGVLKVTHQLSVYGPKLNEQNFDETVYYLELTKSKKHRSVPLNRFAIETIKKEIELSGEEYFIFGPGKTESKTVVIKRGPRCHTVETKHVTNRTVAYALKAICSTANVKLICPHGLRHTFAATFLMNGGDIYTLSKLLGHKSVNTTINYYGHLSSELYPCGTSA